MFIIKYCYRVCVCVCGKNTWNSFFGWISITLYNVILCHVHVRLEQCFTGFTVTFQMGSQSHLGSGELRRLSSSTYGRCLGLVVGETGVTGVPLDLLHHGRTFPTVLAIPFPTWSSCVHSTEVHFVLSCLRRQRQCVPRSRGRPHQGQTLLLQQRLEGP